MRKSDLSDGEYISEIAESELIQFFMLAEGGSGVVRCPFCSQSAHGETVLVRCAQ